MDNLDRCGMRIILMQSTGEIIEEIFSLGKDGDTLTGGYRLMVESGVAADLRERLGKIEDIQRY